MGTGSLKPLNEKDKARVAALATEVKEQVPEVIPFFKELHELGMVDGWRAFNGVAPHDPAAADPPGTVRMSDMQMETMDQTKERMRNGSANR